MIKHLMQAIRRILTKPMVEPSIKMERVFNYCREVTYTDEFGIVTGIVEDSPEFSKNGILIWENEFKVSEERRKLLLAKLVAYLDSQNIKHTIFYGQSRV
jgi:hypothetical protein